MFVDYAKIYVEAGDGGDGCVSFRREKYVPRGGPDGGDGGRGGNVILVTDPHMGTLLDLKMKPRYVAKRGQHGMGNQCTGRGGEDVYVKVPLGTVVSTEGGETLADLVLPGQEFLAAAGGRGGRGNQHFASANNKAPRRWEEGGEGEKRKLILELKVIADVGLVGLPNAGKSTLLSVLTAATPKVAPYPFTTLHPNLGVLEFADSSRCVVADIPGLIEGASQGAGLGDRFLRHIERTTLLVHLVAPPEGSAPDDDASDGEEDAEDSGYEAGEESSGEGNGSGEGTGNGHAAEPAVGVPASPDQAKFEHYWYAWELVNSELSSYSDLLANKRQIVCITKTDLLPPGRADEIGERFRQRGVDTLRLSSHNGEGVPDLIARLHAELQSLRIIEPPMV